MLSSCGRPRNRAAPSPPNIESDTRKPVIMPAPMSRTLGSNRARHAAVRERIEFAGEIQHLRNEHMILEEFVEPRLRMTFGGELVRQRTVGTEQPTRPPTASAMKQRPRLLHGFDAFGIKTLQRLRRRDAGRKFQLL